MPRSDDVVPFLTPPPSSGIRYGQGILKEWNLETFENQVEWQGITLTNLPVHAGVDALTFQAGDLVSLNGWAPSGGAGSWWIASKIIIPGSDAAQQAISFLRTNLAGQIVDDLVSELLTSPAGSDLAAFVFGERFRAASTAATVGTSSASYVTLSGGPSVSDVEVSDGGTMVVMVGCNGAVSSVIGSPDQAAAMSFQISGASSVSPVDGNAYILAHADLGEDSFVWSRSMAVARITGLNPGTHTVAARYRKMFGGGSVEFTDRTLIAIGL